MRPSLVLLLGFCLVASAQEAFWLQGNDGMEGPFAFRPGAPVRIGTNTYSLVTSVPAEVFDRLDRIVIPEIDLRNATMTDAIGILNDILDKAGPADKVQPISLALVSTPRQESRTAGARTNVVSEQSMELPRITFSARHISALEAIKIMCGVCDLKYRTEGRRIVIMPLETPDVRQVERTYDVGTNFLSVIEAHAGRMQEVTDPFAPVGVGSTNTAARARTPTWTTYCDVSGGLCVSISSGGRREPRSALYCQSSGLLTLTMGENFLDTVERLLEEVCGRKVDPKPVPVRE